MHNTTLFRIGEKVYDVQLDVVLTIVGFHEGNPLIGAAPGELLADFDNGMCSYVGDLRHATTIVGRTICTVLTDCGGRK